MTQTAQYNSEIQHVHSSQQVQIIDTSSQTRNTTQLTQGT